MLNHIGFVAWTGCGFMGPTPGKIEGVLPNYGVGLRIEVQPRMNVRLDLGKNTVNNQMLFYFNMTESPLTHKVIQAHLYRKLTSL